MKMFIGMKKKMAEAYDHQNDEIRYLSSGKLSLIERLNSAKGQDWVSRTILG